MPSGSRVEVELVSDRGSGWVEVGKDLACFLLSTCLGLVFATVIGPLLFEPVYQACNCGSSARFQGGCNSFEGDLKLIHFLTMFSVSSVLINLGVGRLFAARVRILFLFQLAVLTVATLLGWYYIVTFHIGSGVRPGCLGG